MVDDEREVACRELGREDIEVRPIAERLEALDDPVDELLLAHGWFPPELDPGAALRRDDAYGIGMLTVTEAAAQAINSLVTEHQMPEGSGLRITRQGETTRAEGLGLSIAAAPAEDDSVLEDHGVRVFLPPVLVKVLEDQELDVEPVTEGGEEGLRFTVNPRPAGDQG